MALVGDRQAAAHALSLLTLGPSLMPYLDPGELLRQARAAAADANTKKAEKEIPHPLLLRRLARVMAVK